MRTVKGVTALALVAALAAACSSGSASPSAAPSVAASTTPSVAASEAPSPTPDACAPANLALKTAGKLTIGTDNPAYPPYYAPRKGGNTPPWDKDQGDPTTGEGFESAVAYAVAQQLGFAQAGVAWVVAPFNTAIAPGPKAFDFDINQVSYTADRAQSNDLTDGYYSFNQTVVVLKAGKFASAKTLADLAGAKLGAQVGTTSLNTIQNIIKPTAQASIYDSNDAAIQALEAKQIDGIVVDLPTAFFITNVQAPDTTIVGQVPTVAGKDQEHFSLLLDKGSALTPCLNHALAALKTAGTLDQLVAKWLPDSSVPELKP